MQKLYFQVAGSLIEINFHKAQSSHREKIFKKMMQTHFKGFITQINKKQPDYTINFIEQNHFELLKKKGTNKHFINIAEYFTHNTLTSYYHISISQFQFILRNVIQILLTENNGFILHGSACVINRKACLFTGSSGAGKSTVIKLLKNHYQALADDSIIIRKIGSKFYLYQIPITEKEWWVEKGSAKYPLEKIFFLRQANIFRIDGMKDKDKILKDMLKQFWTNDGIYAKKQMRTLFAFVSHFHNFYTLSFRKEKNGLMKLLERGQGLKNQHAQSLPQPPPQGVQL